MKLGISSSLKHETPIEWAKKMSELDCQSVVFPVDCNASDRLINAYKDAAQDYDLQIAEVGIWQNALTENKQAHQSAMDYSIRQLRLADRIGARCCVNVTGAAGPQWDGGYQENFTQKTWDRAVRMIQEVIDEAKPTHTFFTIEPMPWMYPTSPEEYIRLLDAVKRDAFGVHMDIINMICTPQRYFFQEDFVTHCFSLLGEWIKSCHLKDVMLEKKYTLCLRECACGEGAFCLEHYAELAEKTDPNMPMIIEHMHTDEEYIKSMAYVRKRLAKFLS